MSKRFVGVAVLVLLTAFLAACSGDAAPTVQLSADKEYTTTTMQVGTFSFKYPSSWFVTEDNGLGLVGIYFPEDARRNMMSGIEKGKVVVTLDRTANFTRKEQIILKSVDGTVDSETAVTLNGAEGTRLVETTPREKRIGFAIPTGDGDVFVRMIVYLHPEDLSRWEPLIDEIAASVNFALPN